VRVGKETAVVPLADLLTYVTNWLAET
jgi:hypothetical protein